METKNSHSKKLIPNYFEKSLRLPFTLSYFFIFALVLFQKIFTNFGISSQSTKQWLILGSGFIVLLVLEFIEGMVLPKKPHFWMALLFSGIRIFIYYIITLSDPTGITSSVLGYILFTFCFYFHPVFVFLILLIILLVFYENIPLFWLRNDYDIGYVYELFSFIAFYLFGLFIRLDDRIRLRNQSMVRQLEEYASNSISLGKQEERNRISRDLHDSLGHQLVAVNIQLQKAVAYREIDAIESQAAIDKAQEATNIAIKELRHTIKDLREYDDRISFEDELQTMIQRIRDNGLEIICNISGNSKGFPEFTLLTLKQITQEGLTNIEKHAQASHATVNVNFLRKKIVATIKDNGIGFNFQKLEKDGHFGLINMQERLDIIGGKLSIRSKSNDGTELLIELPKEIYG